MPINKNKLRTTCNSYISQLSTNPGQLVIWWCRDGAVVRVLASHQCGPGLILRSGVKCGLSLLVLFSAPRGFLPSPQKPKFDLIVLIVNYLSYSVVSLEKTRHLNKVPYLTLPYLTLGTKKIDRGEMITNR